MWTAAGSLTPLLCVSKRSVDCVYTCALVCVCVCSEAGLQYVSIDFFFYCCLIVKSFCQSVFITVCSNKCFGRSLKISRFFLGGGLHTF